MRAFFQIAIPLTLAALLSACVMSPVTGLVCPPGSHPGPYGHRCFPD